MPLPPPAPRTPRGWVSGTLAALRAGGAVGGWGIVATTGSVRPEVTGYAVESDAMVVVEYDLHRPEGVAVVCRISALDASKARVGTVEDAVPAAGPTSVHRVVEVRTSVRAVTGVVESCTRVAPGG